MMKTKQIRLMASAAVFLVLLGSGLAYYQYAYAVTRTWDGGGVDGTCGGAGTANNWTCAANWSGDTVPTGSDIASFDATSTKNATINAGISVAGISIAVGYTGTITQSAAYSVTVGSSHWVQAGGTFTGGSGTIDINGTYTLSGGTFTSTSGVFEVGRVAGSETIFALSSGTFNHNNGTVRFAPSDTCTFNTSFTVDIATSLTLYDVVVNAIQACGGANILTLASGDSVIITHDFTQTDGILGGAWEARNNITIGSGADGNKDSSVLTMTGTGAKTYTYTTGGTGPHLRINNASLSVSANAGTTDLKVALFSLMAGTFTAPSGTMTVGRMADPETIFALSGGTFNHNNGTISFVARDTCIFNAVFTIDVIASLTLNNVTANLSQECGTPPALSTAAGDTIIVLGNFTHANSVLNGVWEVQGDYTVAAAADGGTASIAFTGGNSQTYTDSGGDEADGDITINKTAGTVTLASNADWNATGQDVTVTAGTLAQSSYILNANNFTVNGGIYAGGSNTMDVNGTFTLSSGTFTSTSGVFEVGMDEMDSQTIFAVSGGTFAHNNGTVRFSLYRTYGDRIYTVDILGSLTLYDVDINTGHAHNGNNVITAAAGDTLLIAGRYTQTDGLLGGAWEAQGDIVIGSGAGGGTGTLTMAGTGAKTYTYTTGGIGPHLRINNASLSVSANAGTTDLSVAYFSLLAGTFVAPVGALNIGVYDQATGEIFVVSGGVFDHNRGIVSFVSASAYWTTFTINVPTSLTLYDVSWSPIAVNSSYLTTAAGDTLIVAHDFSHVRGILDGTWEVQGDYTVAAAAIGGTASIAFTGGNSQTYTNQGGDEANGDITVNKSGGAIALTSNADWNAAGQDVTVAAGTLSVGPGTLSTNAITVAAGATFQMTSSGDLTLASTLTNNGLVHIWGNDTCGGSDAVQIRSSSSGVQRSWNGTGTFSIYDADIQDMAGAAAITVYSSTNNGNNGANWTFSGAACPAAALTPAMTLGTGSFYLGSGVVNLR